MAASAREKLVNRGRWQDMIDRRQALKARLNEPKPEAADTCDIPPDDPPETPELPDDESMIEPPGVLMPRDLADDKPAAGMLSCARWVMEMLAVEDVTPCDAPDAKAWLMYQVYSKDHKTRQAFIEKFGPLISKVEEESHQAFADDGRSVLELIAKFPGHEDALDHLEPSGNGCRM